LSITFCRTRADASGVAELAAVGVVERRVLQVDVVGAQHLEAGDGTHARHGVAQQLTHAGPPTVDRAATLVVDDGGLQQHAAVAQALQRQVADDLLGRRRHQGLLDGKALAAAAPRQRGHGAAAAQQGRHQHQHQHQPGQCGVTAGRAHFLT